MHNRRAFITASVLGSLGVMTSSFNAAPSSLVPSALKKGDTIALICPAHPLLHNEDLVVAQDILQSLGYKVKVGKHVKNRYGYLAGTDQERAADVNDMFDDSSVNAIMAIHGGWGCARILPYLNYDLIRKNPKILVGYSDVTALLNAIYAKAGLVTFHGPVATSTWNTFTIDHFQKTLVEAQMYSLQNPMKLGDAGVATTDRITTLYPGKAKGELVGGNLTVFSAMVGSSYLPDFKNKILFLEDVDEAVYRIDRMLTHLKLAGILDQISGFIWGKCTDCEPSKGYGSLTFDQIFEDHIKPLKIPAFSGAMIGHIKDKFTIPVGLEVEMDASLGSITFLSPAVRK